MCRYHRLLCPPWPPTHTAHGQQALLTLQRALCTTRCPGIVSTSPLSVMLHLYKNSIYISQHGSDPFPVPRNIGQTLSSASSFPTTRRQRGAQGSPYRKGPQLDREAGGSVSTPKPHRHPAQPRVRRGLCSPCSGSRMQTFK